MSMSPLRVQARDTRVFVFGRSEALLRPFCLSCASMSVDLQ